MVLEILLPRTDAGAILQLVVTLTVGVPLLVLAIRKASRDVAWFVAGLLMLTLGFFAIRTLH